MAAVVYTPLPYWPNWWQMANILRADVLVLEAQEHFQKRSPRNRCTFPGPNKVQQLTIPLLHGKNNAQPVQEVQIAYHEPWHRQHWQSLRTAYGNAPFFEYYGPVLEQLYLNPGTSLWDFNLRLLHQSLRWLKHHPKLVFTTSFREVPFPAYTDLSATFSSGSDQQTVLFPSFPQVFTERHGFVANTSIIDLLMCQGPAASVYLLNRINQP